MLVSGTVSETAPNDQQPMDDDTINGVRQLIKESGKIHANILQAAQNANNFKELENEDPFEEAEDQKMLRMGYKYKLFKLASDITVCVRCTINFHEAKSDETCNMYVLPQWNNKRQTWQRDLDSQTTVMLTKEITDNSCKFSRWTVQSILAGVDLMRFAFVSRVNESNQSHKVVGHASVNPEQFAQTINLNISNCWAILKDLINTVKEQERDAAQYLYIKDVVQTNYRLIHMVEIEQESESDEDDETGL